VGPHSREPDHPCAATLLEALGLPADAIATSGQWCVAKPDPAFFARVTAWAPGDPAQIVYVGDHPDNDIIPAKAASLRTAHLRCGPWGYLWADDSTMTKNADWRVSSLAELVSVLTS
jgi:FMN phosphatase YigB (HAD superfamily)